MSRLPTLFISHGSPTFAIEPGQAGPALHALGKTLPKPTAILVVSPHWMSLTPRVSFAVQPETIHDFGGFERELYQLQYPAPGHPALAQKTLQSLLDAGWPAHADPDYGLDHGAWVPLLHLYPEANVPVFQVSLPARLDGPRAWALGRALAPMADEGVLIIGSGSLTHNLSEFQRDQGPTEPYVEAFVAWVREAIEQGDAQRLQRTLQDAPYAQRAHPTPEHFWPLIVAAGAAKSLSPVQVIEGGVAYRMLSMDGFVFGG